MKPGMRNNMKKLILSVLSVLIFCTLLTSCGDVGYTEDEIRETAKNLIESSYEINEIYFGEGLPVTGEDSVGSRLYTPVTDDCKYHSTSEIKAATEKVYTADYCKILFKTGFEGTSLESEENVRYARFIDDFDGRLTARKDLAESAITRGRTFDYDSAEIVKMKKDRAEITYITHVDGEKDLSVTVTLLKDESGWRLDTPTY